MTDRTNFKIPESTFSFRDLEAFLADLDIAIRPLRRNEIVVYDSKHVKESVPGPSDLISKLRKLRPIERQQIGLEYSGLILVGKTRRSVRARVILAKDDNSSLIEVSGNESGRNEILDKMKRCLVPYSRRISNKVGGILVPLCGSMFVAILNILYPSSIFAGTVPSSLLIGTVSAAGLLFFHFRPHCLFRATVVEELLFATFEDLLRVIPKLIALILLTGIFISLPNMTGLDLYRLRSDQAIQRHVLRTLMNTSVLTANEELRKAAQLYDKLAPDERGIAVQQMVGKINALMESKAFGGRAPLGKLDYFFSSATVPSSRDGNWLQEPFLLMNIGDPKKGTFIYRPRIFEPDFLSRVEHALNAGSWRDEVVLKDKYGNSWTRETLIRDLEAEGAGNISIDRKDRLENIRKFPEEKLEFQIGTKRPLTPQNSVIEESVRAIAEEMIRSMGTIQRELSGNPDYLETNSRK